MLRRRASRPPRCRRRASGVTPSKRAPGPLRADRAAAHFRFAPSSTKARAQNRGDRDPEFGTSAAVPCRHTRRQGRSWSLNDRRFGANERDLVDGSHLATMNVGDIRDRPARGNAINDCLCGRQGNVQVGPDAHLECRGHPRLGACVKTIRPSSRRRRARAKIL